MGQWQRGHRSDTLLKSTKCLPRSLCIATSQEPVHSAQSMKATQCGGAETESREGTCQRLELRV